MAVDWLGEELPAFLATNLQGISDGSVSSGTRGKVVEAMEILHAKILNKALQEVRPTSTRAAWAWRRRDKVSAAWLLAISGYGTSLSSAQFAEAAASNICLPSPACSDRVGEVIRGNVEVDKYGENVQATAMVGDHWRSRHNTMLHHLANACMWAGLPVELEVLNLFTSLVRQEGLSPTEQARQLQTMIPDMKITMPEAGTVRGGGGGVGALGLVAEGLAGQSSSILHELKVISSNRTRYRPACQRRADDVQAAQLKGEYLSKARAADRQQGMAQGEGRVEAKLVSLGHVEGIISGQFGEVSEATHALVATLATSRVRVAGPTRGRGGLLRSEDAERAVAVSALRCRLGVMAVRCQCSSLLGRLETMGLGGAAAVGQRRKSAELEWSQTALQGLMFTGLWLPNSPERSYVDRFMVIKPPGKVLC
jgi:hypothetical protein